jgi:hypothetical protein
VRFGQIDQLGERIGERGVDYKLLSRNLPSPATGARGGSVTSGLFGTTSDSERRWRVVQCPGAIADWSVSRSPTVADKRYECSPYLILTPAPRSRHGLHRFVPLCTPYTTLFPWKDRWAFPSKDRCPSLQLDKNCNGGTPFKFSLARPMRCFSVRQSRSGKYKNDDLRGLRDVGNACEHS